MRVCRMSDYYDDKNQQSVFDDDTYEMWDEESNYASYREYEESLEDKVTSRPEPSFLRALLSKIWPTLAERRENAMARLAEFDDAIVAYPKTAANYVFRGEIYLETRQVELAIDDFSLANELATA